MTKMPARNERLQLVAIHGVPRSGTSWLGQIFNSSEHVAYRYQPLFSYRFRGAIGTGSKGEDIDRFVEDLFQTTDEFVLQTRAAALAGYLLEFPKSQITHLVYKEVRYHQVVRTLLEQHPAAKVIGIVRNPCAVIHSWSHAPKEFRPEWDLREEWRAAGLKNAGEPGNFYGFDRWREVADLFCQLEIEFPQRMMIVRYEDLKFSPVEEASRVLAFCGLNLSSQVRDFVKRSTSTEDGAPYGVMRGMDHDAEAWRQALDPAIRDAIANELKGTGLERYLA